MTKKQKQKVHGAIQTSLKIIGCSSLFIGMTVALGKSNPDMEIFAYTLLFLMVWVVAPEIVIITLLLPLTLLLELTEWCRKILKQK